ncbi:MAG: hypothetical protein LBJ31_07855 [Treponema sp.]|jgi:predicted adenylyl cyclase CyaB|nr:hypothetical protein [Treponema sp.]
MAFEIELKAWVSRKNPQNKDAAERAGAVLSSLGRYGGEYRKSDTYWRGQLPFSIRVRREERVFCRQKTGITLVTYKIKKRDGGIEINDEREFEIAGRNGESAAEGFEYLLERLGMAKTEVKTKQGRVWDCGGINAELSLVCGKNDRPLGWFIELEIIAKDDSAKTRAKAKTRLLELLAKTGIDPENSEDRYYTELLREQAVHLQTGKNSIPLD